MDGTTIKSAYGASQNPLSVDVERLARQNNEKVGLGTGAARQVGQAADQKNGAQVERQAPARDTVSTQVSALQSPASDPIQDPAAAADQLAATRKTIIDPAATSSMRSLHNSGLLKSQIVGF